MPDYEKPLANTGQAAAWRLLSVGDRVAIMESSGYTQTGSVDDRTYDGSTIWVILDDGLGRIAVTEGDPQVVVAD